LTRVYSPHSLFDAVLKALENFKPGEPACWPGCCGWRLDTGLVALIWSHIQLEPVGSAAFGYVRVGEGKSKHVKENCTANRTRTTDAGRAPENV
jgi:hypothetical protein